METVEENLTENDVVDSVKNVLQTHGWIIKSFATTSQAGVDIHAEKGKRSIYIEAKGITSSKSSSKRHGMLMTSSQCFIQVAAALLKTCELRGSHLEADVAIALPEHPRMRERISRIETVLRESRIGVLWVSLDKKVIAWNLNLR